MPGTPAAKGSRKERKPDAFRGPRTSSARLGEDPVAMSQPLDGFAKNGHGRARLADASAVVDLRAPRADVGHVRWWICFLLFVAATINYVDRHIIGLLKPILSSEFHVDDVAYAHIITAFQLAYAIGMLSMGRVLDAIGTRRGFAVAATIWGLAAMGHALAGSATGVRSRAARARLRRGGHVPRRGEDDRPVVSEEGARARDGPIQLRHHRRRDRDADRDPRARRGWPAARGVRRDRNARPALGRRSGSPSMRPPRSTRASPPAELDYIQSDPIRDVGQDPLARHSSGAGKRWPSPTAKFLTDPFWWLYLFWVPDFLHRRHGLDLAADGASARDDLCPRRSRQHRGRLALVAPDRSRVDGECGAQGVDGRLRCARRANRVRRKRGVGLGQRRFSSVSRPPDTRASRQTSSR